MNIADLLNKLGVTAGIKEDNEEFKALVQTKEFASTNIPEELGTLFSTALDEGLLSVEAAKNNESLKNHFFATFANGIDSEIENAIGTLDIDEETKTLLKNTDSSFKKISLLPTRLKSKYEGLLEEAKKGDKNPEDIEKLNTQISELNGELSSLKDTTVLKTEYDQAISNHSAQVKSLNIKNLVSGRKLTTTLPRNVVIPAAMQVLTDELKAKGISLDDDLNLKTSDGSQDYYVNNQPVKVGDFIDNLLTENKLLEVSPDGGNPNPPAPDGGNPNPAPQGKNAFDEHADTVEQLMERNI